MGIIVSCFEGCGKESMVDFYSDRISIFDAKDVNVDNMVDEVLDKVLTNDIVFIPCTKKVRKLFNESKVDYDLFYPSKKRRPEIIEFQVRERVKPDKIRELDNNFDKWIDEIDLEDAPNCYKHELSEREEFIGNNGLINGYIDQVIESKKQNNTNNDES